MRHVVWGVRRLRVGVSSTSAVVSPPQNAMRSIAGSNSVRRDLCAIYVVFDASSEGESIIQSPEIAE